MLLMWMKSAYKKAKSSNKVCSPMITPNDEEGDDHLRVTPMQVIPLAMKFGGIVLDIPCTIISMGEEVRMGEVARSLDHGSNLDELASLSKDLLEL